MKPITALVLATLGVQSSLALPIKDSFDELNPRQWQSGAYGQAEKLSWVIEKDQEGNSYLIKKGYGVYAFNVRNDSTVENGSVELKFNIGKGKEDPEAGVVWRFQDPKNYLYVRANSLENNVTFYRMLGGKKELVKEAATPVKPSQWHSLKVTFNKSSIQIFLNSKEVLTLKDSRILKAGKVGVWSTADTEAKFDDLIVTADLKP